MQLEEFMCLIKVKLNFYILDTREVTNKLSKKESNDLEKFNEKKGELLLEAISSDDDIAMDSEEDGALVLYIYIN